MNPGAPPPRHIDDATESACLLAAVDLPVVREAPIRTATSAVPRRNLAAFCAWLAGDGALGWTAPGTVAAEGALPDKTSTRVATAFTDATDPTPDPPTYQHPGDRPQWAGPVPNSVFRPAPAPVDGQRRGAELLDQVLEAGQPRRRPRDIDPCLRAQVATRPPPQRRGEPVRTHERETPQPRELGVSCRVGVRVDRRTVSGNTSRGEEGFRALWNTRRRTILEAPAVGPATVGELGDLLSITRPGDSRHLKIPSEAALVEVRDEAQCRAYVRRPEPRTRSSTS